MKRTTPLLLILAAGFLASGFGANRGAEWRAALGATGVFVSCLAVHRKEPRVVRAACGMAAAFGGTTYLLHGVMWPMLNWP